VNPVDAILWALAALVAGVSLIFVVTMAAVAFRVFKEGPLNGHRTIDTTNLPPGYRLEDLGRSRVSQEVATAIELHKRRNGNGAE